MSSKTHPASPDGGGSSRARPLQSSASGLGEASDSCLLLKLPIEVQNNIVDCVSKKSLNDLQRVSKHFRDLASARIYGEMCFFLTAPESHFHLSKREFRLSYALRTIALSEYNYAQHIKAFSVSLTERIPTEMNRQVVARFQWEEEASRLLNALMEIVLRKATKLEWFRWMVPVELSYDIYRTLASITTLRQFCVDLETLAMPAWSPRSLTASPNSVVIPGPPPIMGPPQGIPIQQSASQFTNPFLPNSMGQNFLLTRPTAPTKNAPPSLFLFKDHGSTFSLFQNLVSLEATGIDRHDYVGELAGCMKSCSPSLKNLCLSMSRFMACYARKPGDPGAVQLEQPPINVLDDGDMTEPLTPTEEPPGAPADAEMGIDPDEEKKFQDAMLARIFCLDPDVPEDKAVDRHLKSVTPQSTNTTEVDIGDVLQDMVEMARRAAGKKVPFDLKQLVRSPLFAILMEKTIDQKAMAEQGKKKASKGDPKVAKKGNKPSGQSVPIKSPKKPGHASSSHAFHGPHHSTHAFGGSVSKAGPSFPFKAPPNMGGVMSPKELQSLYKAANIHSQADLDQLILQNFPLGTTWTSKPPTFDGPSSSQTWTNLPPNAPKVSGGASGWYAPGPSSSSKHTMSQKPVVVSKYTAPLPPLVDLKSDDYITNEAYKTMNKAKYGPGHMQKKKKKHEGKKEPQTLPDYDYSAGSTESYDSETTDTEPSIPYFPAAEQKPLGVGDDIDLEHPDVASDEDTDVFTSSEVPEPAEPSAATTPVEVAGGQAAAGATTSPANASSSDMESLAASASKVSEEPGPSESKVAERIGTMDAPAPLPSQGKIKRSREERARETMEEYLLMTHGFSIEKLVIYLIPVKASVLARAIDLTCLTSLMLLSVGPQGAFWMLMNSQLEAGLIFKLKTIYTDDVSLAFLTFLSSSSGLENLFMLTRNKKEYDCTTSKVPASLDDIRTLALRTHATTLKRLMINNNMTEDWNLDAKCIRLLAAKAKNLKELSFCTSVKGWHTFIQAFPRFESLIAIHLVRISRIHYGQQQVLEFKDSLLDALHLSPKSKLKYFGLAQFIFQIVRRPTRPPGYPKRSLVIEDEKGKGKAPARFWDPNAADSDNNEDGPGKGAAKQAKGKGKAPVREPAPEPQDLHGILEGLAGSLGAAGAKGKGKLGKGPKDGGFGGDSDGDSDGDGQEAERWSDIENEERTIAMSKPSVFADPECHPRIMVFSKRIRLGRF